jgi:tRNA pseudouridine13 synthase
MNLPYLTSDLPGIGGRIRELLEDFRVEELPLYPTTGRGTHTWFRVVKRGIPTPVAVARIARYMGVRTMDVGVAGLKDAKAVTSQRMSIEYAQANRLERYRDAQMRIHDVTWHSNKLRTGHLAGNRFAIRIRGVGADQLSAAQAIIDVLVARGVPNYFGHQRFGARGDTGQLGETLVRDDLDDFVQTFLGRPRAEDPPETRRAREAFDAGRYDLAQKLWPPHFADQRRALAAFKKKRRPAAALTAIDKRIRRLFVSAFQSEIFNTVLSRRLEGIDRVEAGDLALKHDSGAIFPVEDVGAEAPRALRLEISPTGPIVGYRSDLAGGRPGQLERQVLAERRITPEDFTRVGSLRVKGSRRALRFTLGEPELQAGRDKAGAFLELSFSAPPGCYATVVLRELMKNSAAEGDVETTTEDGK